MKGVYRFLDEDNNILYIGKSLDIKKRMASHKELPIQCYKSIHSIEYIELETEDDINFIESYLIATIKPKFNTSCKKKNYSFGIEWLENAEWKTYYGKFPYQTTSKEVLLGKVKKDTKKLLEIIKQKRDKVKSLEEWLKTSEEDNSYINEILDKNLDELYQCKNDYEELHKFGLEVAFGKEKIDELKKDYSNCLHKFSEYGVYCPIEAIEKIVEEEVSKCLSMIEKNHKKQGYVLYEEIETIMLNSLLMFGNDIDKIISQFNKYFEEGVTAYDFAMEGLKMLEEQSINKLGNYTKKVRKVKKPHNIFNAKYIVTQDVVREVRIYNNSKGDKIFK